METKKCKHCGIEKELDKFPKTRIGNRINRCNTCGNKRDKNILFNAFLSAYGGMCACCGESDPRFLTLDHINNDGYKEKELFNLSGDKVYRIARREGFPKDKYQIMCYNCNIGKHRNGGVCPHKDDLTERKLKIEMQRMLNLGYTSEQIIARFTLKVN